jgi:hypothetical protein
MPTAPSPIIPRQAADELAQKQSGSGTDEQNYNGAFI